MDFAFPLSIFFISVFFVLVDSVFWHNTVNRNFRGNHKNLSPWLLANIGNGGQLALEHCQHQFQWQRWNCPRHVFQRWNMKPIQRPNKELSFLNSIISAAIVYTVARNCSRGYSCQGLRPRRNVENNWVSHLSDEIDYGEYIVQSYLENTTPGVDPASYVIRHNIALGRRIVRVSSAKKCMCHGMSGTCTLKSCWTQMASFPVIAANLKERYDSAIRLDYEGTRGIKIGNSAYGTALRFRGRALPGVKNDQLIYMQDSPDYCKPNVSSGWAGTKGRTCTRSKEDKAAAKSCQELCKKCGYNVRRKKKGKKLCNCKFTWCCKVTCDTCADSNREYVCS